MFGSNKEINQLKEQISEIKSEFHRLDSLENLVVLLHKQINQQNAEIIELKSRADAQLKTIVELSKNI